MKKIVFLIGSVDDNGGVETVLLQLSSSFVKEGFTVSVVNLFGSKKNKEKFEDIGCGVYDLFDKKISYLLTPLYIFRLRRLLKKLSPDFSIDMGTHFSLFSIMSVLGLRTKSISCEHVNLYASLKNFIIKFVFCRFSDQVVTLTERDKGSYKKIGVRNVTCIPNYTCHASISKELLIDNQNSKNLIAVGRLGYQKSFDRLIEIWARVNDKKGYSLHIWGEGEDYSKLESLIESNNLQDSCKLMGSTDSITHVYRNAYALLMTSVYEGFPMVLIESMSHGVPVISYDCPTGPSEIIVDGVNGYLIEDGNKFDFLDKLEYIINNENARKVMSSSCLSRRYVFSEEHIIKLWRSLFDELI